MPRVVPLYRTREDDLIALLGEVQAELRREQRRRRRLPASMRLRPKLLARSRDSRRAA